jgi:hypothetical protein
MRFNLASPLIPLLLAAAAACGDPAASLRQRYLDANGLPSEAAYRQAQGIAPAAGSETYSWRVIFKLSYRAQDLARLDSAQPIATDCYLVRTRKYVAPYRAASVWDGRVYQDGDKLVVAEFTSQCEQVVGQVSEDGDGIVFAPHARAASALVRPLRGARYNPFSGRLWRRESGGSITEKQEFYLPFALTTPAGARAECSFGIVRQDASHFALVAGASGAQQVVVARCAVGADTIVARSDGYSPRLGPGCVIATAGPTTILEVRGELADDAVDARAATLVLRADLPPTPPRKPHVAIDGDFSEWRNVPGVADPRGDIPGYLDYDPDTDILEFKVANDERRLNFYTRVAGRHGNTLPGDNDDRFYYYVYIDADRSTATGYLPTRDDDCYYGVAIGDDCEAQYEFVGGRFVKAFFGFTGAGGEKETLSGRVKLGASWYSKEDAMGRARDRYKVEYVKRGGKLHITGDYTEGTSDDIVVALSPDGSECEVSVEMEGFLRDPSGKPLIAAGQRIDLAVGMEASGRARGNRRWGADSTAPIDGYCILP